MLLDLVDGRWLGLCPLSRHIVICGFPRSGSTLLLLMVETSFTGNQSGAAVGRGAARRFEDFHARVPRRFDVTALNGVRPLDPDAITRWREPRHRDRMRSVIRDMPELGDVLIEMGYETDTSWMAGYRT